MVRRILHITSSISKNSGVMSVIMNYYKNIDREKVQFDFLFFKETNCSYASEIEELGGKMYLSGNPKNIINFIKYTNNFFGNHSEYTAVHLHAAYLNSVVFPIAKRHGIKHTIIHSHTTKYSDKRINSFRNQLLCIPLIKNSDHLVACSNAAGEFWYGKERLSQGNVYILKNAIDSDKYRYSQSVRKRIRKDLKLNDDLVIGHVGRFSEPKNHSFLIDVFAQVCKKHRNSKLILAGDGPLRDKTYTLVKKLGLENNVLFLGMRSDVHHILQAMDILVLPSLYEGLPVIGVEAQAAGLPCIISDTVTEEIKISDLVTFKSINAAPSEWANVILQIIDESHRCDTTNQIRKAGYNIKYEAEKLQDFYLRLK